MLNQLQSLYDCNLIIYYSTIESFNNDLKFKTQLCRSDHVSPKVQCDCDHLLWFLLMNALNWRQAEKSSSQRQDAKATNANVKPLDAGVCVCSLKGQESVSVSSEGFVCVET